MRKWCYATQEMSETAPVATTVRLPAPLNGSVEAHAEELGRARGAPVSKSRAIEELIRAGLAPSAGLSDQKIPLEGRAAQPAFDSEGRAEWGTAPFRELIRSMGVDSSGAYPVRGERFIGRAGALIARS